MIAGQRAQVIAAADLGPAAESELLAHQQGIEGILSLGRQHHAKRSRQRPGDAQPAAQLGEIHPRPDARYIRRAIVAGPQDGQALRDIQVSGPVAAEKSVLQVADAEIGDPPAVAAERRAQDVHIRRLEGDATLEHDAFGPGALQRPGETGSHRPGIGQHIECRQGGGRLATRDGSDQAEQAATVAHRMQIAKLGVGALQRLVAQRACYAGGKLVAAVEHRIERHIPGRRPEARIARTAIVDGKAAGNRRIGHRHHQVRGAGRVRRGTQQARSRDPRQIVGHQQRLLDRDQLERPGFARRPQIGPDAVLGVGIAAFHRDIGDEAFHHIDGENAVGDALRRHEGAHQDIAVAAIFGLDRVGDVENIRQADLFADQLLIEGPEARRRNRDRAFYLDILELEADLVHRARHRGATRRLDAEIEIGLRRHRQSRPVAARLDRARQPAGNLCRRDSDSGKGAPCACQRPNQATVFEPR